MSKKTIRFDDGSEVTVVKENGRYYICEDGRQFRKTNSHIISVEGAGTVKYVQNVVVPEEEIEEKPLIEQEFVQVHEKKRKNAKEDE